MAEVADYIVRRGHPPYSKGQVVTAPVDEGQAKVDAKLWSEKPGTRRTAGEALAELGEAAAEAEVTTEVTEEDEPEGRYVPPENPDGEPDDDEGGRWRRSRAEH